MIETPSLRTRFMLLTTGVVVVLVVALDLVVWFSLRDRLEDTLPPVGRASHAFSTLVCPPASLSQEGRRGLGAQAGETRLREVLTRAGFRSIRRAAESPFNMVLEARA